MIEIQKGSRNVYSDLRMPDADGMYLKARLASKIREIINQRQLTQRQAADIIGITQPKLSGLLRGYFRGISEAKMIACLNLLGSDVDIVVHRAHQDFSEGQTQVTFS